MALACIGMKKKLLVFGRPSKKGWEFLTSPIMTFNLADLIQPVEGLHSLIAPFCTDEIDNIVQNMPSNKAPGPDGFNGRFMKTCWNIIKNDFYNLCSSEPPYCMGEGNSFEEQRWSWCSQLEDPEHNSAS